MSVLEVARSLGALHDARLALYCCSKRVHRQNRSSLQGARLGMQCSTPPPLGARLSPLISNSDCGFAARSEVRSFVIQLQFFKHCAGPFPLFTRSPLGLCS